MFYKMRSFWQALAKENPILISMVYISVAVMIILLNVYLGGSTNTFRYMGF